MAILKIQDNKMLYLRDSRSQTSHLVNDGDPPIIDQ